MKGEKYKGYILTDNKWDKAGVHYLFNTFKVYFANERRNVELLHKRDFEESFTGQFLKAGFETYGVVFVNGDNDLKLNPKRFKLYKKSISPTTNWFGTSLYEPDTIFVKDEIQMVMSLGGVEAPYNEKYKQLFDQKSIKYIRIQKKNKTLYEDWTGNLPPKELINELFNLYKQGRQ